MTNYTKVAFRGAAIVLVVSLLAAFLGYLVRFLLARNLSVEEFGLFYAVFSFLGLLGIFKSLGLDRSLVKFIPEFMHKGNNNLIKSSIIYVSIVQLITNSIVIVLVYLFSSYLGVHYFHNPRADIVLKLMAIAFFIDSFTFTLKFAFQGFQKMMLFAGIDLVRMVLILSIAFIGFKLNYKLLSPIIAYIFVPFILIFAFTPILTKKVFPKFFKSKFISNRAIFRKILKYSIFVIATDAGTLILGYTDTIVLTYFSGLVNVALYNVALPTAKLLTFFPKAVMGVLAPLSAELWAKREKILLRDGMDLLYKYSIMIILPLVFVMFSFSGLLLNVFFGKDYILASNSLKILSVGMIFAALFGINSSFFSGIGKPQINSKVVYTAAIFNLAGNLILIPIIGIVGAAITTTIGYFIMMYMGLAEIRKFIYIILPIKIWIKTSLIGLIFIFTIWYLKKIIFLNVWLETAIVLAISGIVYITLLFLLKVIDINEVKELHKRVVK